MTEQLGEILSCEEEKILLNPEGIERWLAPEVAEKIRGWAQSLQNEVAVSHHDIRVIRAAIKHLRLGTSFDPWNGGRAFEMPGSKIIVTAGYVRRALGGREDKL